MAEQNGQVSRRDFLKTAAAGLALGLVGKPAFSAVKEEHDLVVISGDPAAATKATAIVGANSVGVLH